MNSIFAELLTLAKKVDNYEADATGATAYWPDTTHYRATVPAGKRWFLFGGIVWRDVAAIASTYLKNSSDQILMYLAYAASGTGGTGYPLSAVYSGPGPIPMNAGDYVEITLGVAQSTVAYASCVVLEVDV